MLHSVLQMSKIVNQNYSTIYGRVTKGTLPVPSVTIGRRVYYDESGKVEFVRQYQERFAVLDDARVLLQVKEAKDA